MVEEHEVPLVRRQLFNSRYLSLFDFQFCVTYLISFSLLIDDFAFHKSLILF